MEDTATLFFEVNIFHFIKGLEHRSLTFHMHITTNIFSAQYHTTIRNRRVSTKTQNYIFI
jgi:hypothetical protein